VPERKARAVRRTCHFSRYEPSSVMVSGDERMIMRIVLCVMALLAIATPGHAQQLTTVTDKLTTPFGGGVVGRITISANQTFTTADGFTIPAGSKTYVTLGAAGSFSVQLAPTIGAAPAGSTYSVDYSLGTAFVHEIWIVPISLAPINLAAVRVIWPKAPNVSIPSSQFLPPPGCVSTQVLRWTTAGWICAPDNTGAVTFDVETPAPSDSGLFQWKPKNGVTLTRISCSTDSGTAAINLEVRTEAAPNTPGTPVLTSPVTCTPSTGVATTFSASAVPGTAPVVLNISSVTGAPLVVRVHVEYQLN